MSRYPDPPINICPKLIPSKVYENSNAMECVFCWQPKSEYLQQEIKLLNSKYCHLNLNYKKTFKQIIPNFEHCKTLYTKCDHYLEKKVHEYIIKLEDLFKYHQQLVKEELDKQKQILDEMWLQSQRYLILTQSIPCVKPYPEIVSIDREQNAFEIFYSNLRKINASNCILAASIENLETTRNELRRYCDQLDKTVESPFITGSYYLKPLSYILQILNDLFNYFYNNLCKQNSWAQIIDIGDSVSVEDYMNLLKSTKENDLMNNLNRCKCLRSERKDYIRNHKTC